MLTLHDKVALVTGGAQGIGAAVAEVFIQCGAVVLITDIQEKKGAALATRLGGNAHFIALDVRNEQDWQQAIDTIIKKFGGLHVVVNNAGITGFQEQAGPQDPEKASLDSWSAVHATYLTGTFLGCKYAIGAMKANTTHSTIINMSSRSGIVGIPRAAAYASSKAAIRNHTKSVALYCAEMKYPITCNSIHPAAILTPMWEAMLGTGENREMMLRKMSESIPLGHFGSPKDVAYAAAYLASNEAKYFTGAELNIDGGILAGAAAPPGENS